MARIFTWMYLLCLLLYLFGLHQTVTATTQSIRKRYRDSLSQLKRRCPDGSYGYRCRFQCHCKKNLVCDKVTGACPRGCREGLWGASCELSNNCYYNGRVSDYKGTLVTTSKNYKCQKWGSQVPHAHNYKVENFAEKTRFPDNFCRKTHDSDKPWCYTMEPRIRWDFCRVSNCACPRGRYGRNCQEECHCLDSAETCTSQSGKCTSGCARGWSGSDCKQVAPCPNNRYGFYCEHHCKCRDHRNCDRFLGPTRGCTCKEGFYNPPHCEPVSSPRIVFFGNSIVNPARPSRFNCTVAALPTPLEGDITLQGPVGRRISRLSSRKLDQYLSTRINIFEVNSVFNDDRFKCVVNSTAGEAELPIVADVYELPKLVSAPKIKRHGRGSNNISLEWQAWNPANGDMGDGPIVSYTIYYRHERDRSYKQAGELFHKFCNAMCSYLLPDLEPNAKYYVYVSTTRVGKGGVGPKGPVAPLFTKCGVPQMAPEIHTIMSDVQFNVSFPKTKIRLTWKDPIKSSVNCKRIRKYIITLTPERAIGQHWGIKEQQVMIMGGGERRVTIPNLEPFTQYCAVVSLENDAGYESPESSRKCIVTPQTAPSSPRSLKVTSYSASTAFLSWEEPYPSYGQATLYKILFWEGEARTPHGREWKTSNNPNRLVYSLSGLRPNTHYRVQVTAVNAAGEGLASEVLRFRTDEGVPGPVMHLTNVSKSQTSIRLQWLPPTVTNGHLVSYVVSCQALQSLSHADTGNIHTSNAIRLPPEVQTVLVANLLPASLYRCQVNATTGRGVGQPAELEVWTNAEDLNPPVSPAITKVTDNTVTIKLHTSNDKSITHYRIIVEKLNSKNDAYNTNSNSYTIREKRNERSAPPYIESLTIGFQTAARNGQRAYVTAQLPPHEARGIFTVGDNKTYDGFFNGPLEQDKRYNVWFAAFAFVDGVQQSAFSKADKPVVARSVSPAGTTSSLPIIIAIIIAFIVIIGILALILLFWRSHRRRNAAEEREKSELPSFGPTIVPEPETSGPPTPIGRMVFPFAGRHDPRCCSQPHL